MITLARIGTLRSVQVGAPRHYNGVVTGQELAREGARPRAWDTSFVRVPSAQPRWLHTTHLEGNAQADTENHGSPTQAVLLYAAAHYPLWQAELGLPEIGPGGFAENFTVDGLSEETACIGDTYALGDARIQVTGPRYPCWKIERRWGIAGLTAQVAATGRTGWYCRVVAEGQIEPGLPIELVERPYPRWTAALTNDLGHGRNADAALAHQVAACPLLNPWWADLVVRKTQGRA